MSKQINWMTASYEAIGKDIASKIEDKEDDDELLETLALKAVAIVRVREDKDKQQVAISRINKGVHSKYPRLESEAPFYWFDHGGKPNPKKWRHNIFKYLTLGRETDQPTDKTTEQPIEQLTESPIEQPIEPTEQATEQVTEQVTEQPTEQTTEQPTEQTTEKPKSKATTLRTRKPKQILKAMTIEQLDLDTDTQSILEDALNHSGMALEDFIKQAIKVYAKTVTGKAKQTSEKLSNVPTSDLLNNPQYSTHPGRAEELTKRAIRAISFYNANTATENADRWMITQSAIAALTGSRQGTIKEIMPKYQLTIDDNNNRPDWGLNPYSNRKPGKDITEIINLAELIPNGVD